VLFGLVWQLLMFVLSHSPYDSELNYAHVHGTDLVMTNITYTTRANWFGLADFDV
jgi:hypothetical protein